MKITNLNQPMLGFDQKPIVIPQEGQEPVTFLLKTALLNCLGSKKPENGKESIEIYKLGIKLFDAEEASIDMAELLLLKSSVEQNTPEYTSMIQGQLLMFLEDLETPAKKSE